jgi:hypothetical protein
MSHRHVPGNRSNPTLKTLASTHHSIRAPPRADSSATQQGQTTKQTNKQTIPSKHLSACRLTYPATEQRQASKHVPSVLGTHDSPRGPRRFTRLGAHRCALRLACSSPCISYRGISVLCANSRSLSNFASRGEALLSTTTARRDRACRFVGDRSTSPTLPHAHSYFA